MSNSVCNCSEVPDRLRMIFKRMFNRDIDLTDNDLLDQNLMDYKSGFAPRDLLCLFFEIEKEFCITIPQEDIVSGNFSSFSNITGIICNQLKC